jgi:hypothetical protein
MEELIDLIASDGSATDVSDRIKQLLYAKAADRVDNTRPEVAAVMFGEDDSTGDNE